MPLFIPCYMFSFSRVPFLDLPASSSPSPVTFHFPSSRGLFRLSPWFLTTSCSASVRDYEDIVCSDMGTLISLFMAHFSHVHTVNSNVSGAQPGLGKPTKREGVAFMGLMEAVCRESSQG